MAILDGTSPFKRLRAAGLTPVRSLGQNFLIDANILDVIEKMAALEKNDVVLEVGPGLGVLTERLINRCGFVHSIEVDSRLAAVLKDEFSGYPGFKLYVADATRMHLSNLSPAPLKFVSNLPYNVATPLVMKSLEELPTVVFWCLMVQKEIADRLFAPPGSDNYGGVSVMTQLLAEKVATRPVSASVFYPRPSIKSSLVAFRRRDAGFAVNYFAQVKAIVYCSFSHRRKKLVNSLAGAEESRLPRILSSLPVERRKKLIQELLDRLGLPVDARPQELKPVHYEKLAEMMEVGF